MSNSCQSVVEAALQLSELERAEVIERLLESLEDSEVRPDDWDPEFIEEVLSRRGDREGAVTWDVLREQARQAE